MKPVLQIISEEIRLWEYENQRAYNIHDLGNAMQHMGYEKRVSEIMTDILLTAYRKSGDKGVVDKYLELTGTNIYPISSGRYVFGYEPTGGGEPQLEGVGDKYAERKFGIPDDQEINYIRQTSAAIQTTDMGKLVGHTTSDYEDSQLSPVYLNPVSLKNFEKDVRAVSDLQGNLYVAQLDGNFVHAGFNNVIKGDANNNTKFITWVRLGNTNRFAYSDSFMEYVQKAKVHEEIKNDIQQRLSVLTAKHPQFEFIPKFYYFANQ